MIKTRTHRAVYIPKGCDQQGRFETGVYIRERQEQAADMARQAGVHEPDDDVHAPSRDILRALGITALCVVAGLLLAHWGAR